MQWQNNSIDGDLIPWKSELYGPLLSWLIFFHPFCPFLNIFHWLFVIVLFLLFLAYALPILVYALLETLTLYCCYCLLEFKIYSPIVDISAILATFMPITGFSYAKIKFTLMFLPYKNYFYSDFLHKYFNRSYSVKWST